MANSSTTKSRLSTIIVFVFVLIGIILILSEIFTNVSIKLKENASRNDPLQSSLQQFECEIIQTYLRFNKVQNRETIKNRDFIKVS